MCVSGERVKYIAVAALFTVFKVISASFKVPMRYCFNSVHRNSTQYTNMGACIHTWKEKQFKSSTIISCKRSVSLTTYVLQSSVFSQL